MLVLGMAALLLSALLRMRLCSLFSAVLTPMRFRPLYLLSLSSLSWLVKARGFSSANFLAVFVRRKRENQLKNRYSDTVRRY